MSGTRQQEELRALKWALGLYILVFALKLGAYFLTGVMVLFAEALHTLSDIFISGFLLVAAIWSRKEADEVHMFGYGRAQNVAALVAATLFISFTSYKLYEEAIPRLFEPEAATYQNLPLALGVIVASMLIAAVPLVQLLRQRERGASAKAQVMELINDELGLLAALVGTALVWWGWPLADPIAAIVVATIIAINAVGLFRENLCFLMGRSPGPEFLAEVRRLARSVPGVVDVHSLRAEYIGPDAVHAGLHVVVPSGLSIEEAHQVAHQVHERIRQEMGCQYCVVHMDAGGEGHASEPKKDMNSPTTVQRGGSR
ncbi:MAG: cation diffusion facilitator family transporter [Anaerolineae bacterium]|nr:cation diffusion facilitator family transporter [Anaerolineae bacterium]